MFSGRYADYEFSVFDALGWMILTSGNVNFVLQTRFYDNISSYGLGISGSKLEYEDVKDNAKTINSYINFQKESYKNIITSFTHADELLNLYGDGNDADMPMFYLGTPENKLSLTQNIFGGEKSAIEHFITNVYSELKDYDKYIAGFYFGDEEPYDKNVEYSKEWYSLQKTAMEELATYAHSETVNKKVVWIPWAVSKENFETISEVVYSGWADIVIMQPGRFYDECSDRGPDVTAQLEQSIKRSIEKKQMIWVTELDANPHSGNQGKEEVLNDKPIPSNVMIGVEYEFDYSRYTGRSRGVNKPVAYPADKELRMQRYDELYKEFIGSDVQVVPVGVYSGGPNEQGMRNIHINNNYHSNRNYFAINSDGNIDDIAVDVMGKNVITKKKYSDYFSAGNFSYNEYYDRFVDVGEE